VADSPTKGAVNIGDIVGVSGGHHTKGAANIGDIVGVSRGYRCERPSGMNSL